MNSNKAYLVVIALVATCVGIRYGVSDTNPFQQSSPTILLFLTAIFSHVLASMADMTKQTTVIAFHVSGIIGCEALLHILVVQFWWYSIINLFLLLLASFLFSNYVRQLLVCFFNYVRQLLLCFFNYISQMLACFFNYVNQLLCGTPSNADLMPNMELQPQEAQV